MSPNRKVIHPVTGQEIKVIIIDTDVELAGLFRAEQVHDWTVQVEATVMGRVDLQESDERLALAVDDCVLEYAKYLAGP